MYGDCNFHSIVVPIDYSATGEFEVFCLLSLFLHMTLIPYSISEKVRFYVNLYLISREEVNAYKNFIPLCISNYLVNSIIKLFLFYFIKMCLLQGILVDGKQKNGKSEFT